MENLEWTEDYKPGWWLRFGHINTIFSAMSRRIDDVAYLRERFELSDGDFVDLDWSRQGSKKLVIALHGLEGNAQRPYIKGMIRYFNANKWDAMGLNFRGCSGEPNRKVVTYHMSKIDDLAEVVEKIAGVGNYQTIVLVGFSLGGSVLLNYLGRMAGHLPKALKGGVAISVPVDLVPSVKEIGSLKNRAYVLRFLNTLNPKMAKKIHLFPDQLSVPEKWPKTLEAFDDYFTSKIHGFDGALDYWTKSSALQYLNRINLPCLLINAQDDSFLSEGCFPLDIVQQNENFHLLAPKYGGHCGFAGATNEKGVLWSEQMTFKFVNKYVP